ncbi:hypothetical protein HYW39_01090 [Candidatus Curtissbacteria bacterium]|nr:hypothetical protein [Candidatus Curtissbacteria bacterium]
MSVETRLGSDQFVGSDLGPQKAEQEFYPKNNHRFPQTREEFVGYLAENWADLWVDVPRAWLDLARAQIELRQLRLRPIDRDRDLPRGDGSTVVIVPGFMGWGRLYRETVKNLRSIGYQAETYPLYFGVNVEPTEAMVDDFVSYLSSKKKETGKKVHVIGHSKGGHLTRTAQILDTERYEDSVDQDIDVGSPIPTRVNLAVGAGYLVSQYVFGGNDFKLTKLVENGEFFRNRNHVRRTTLRIKNDPIVDGIYLGPEEDQFEVKGSHSGALVNRDNLRLIAQRLALSKLAKAA